MDTYKTRHAAQYPDDTLPPDGYGFAIGMHTIECQVRPGRNVAAVRNLVMQLVSFFQVSLVSFETSESDGSVVNIKAVISGSIPTLRALNEAWWDSITLPD